MRISRWLNSQQLDEDLALLLGCEVRIANDANCPAVSEATDGTGAGKKTVFAVIIGTGCGSGIALNSAIAFSPMLVFFELRMRRFFKD